MSEGTFCRVEVHLCLLSCNILNVDEYMHYKITIYHLLLKMILFVTKAINWTLSSLICIGNDHSKLGFHRY